jgi:hypothetical protein
MDSIAKDTARNSDEIVQNMDFSSHPLSFLLPSLWDQQNYIHEKIKHNLCKNLLDTRIREYFVKKEHLQTTSLSSIEWRRQGKALRQMTSSRKHFICKWVSEWIATGSNMEKWKLRYKGNCPFCDRPDEDSKHILLCPHPSALKEWDKQINIFKKKLIKSGTEKYLRGAIIKDLTAWRFQKPLPHLTYLEASLKFVITEQRKIGRKAFLEGIVSSSLTVYQQEFFKNCKSNEKISAWSTKLIKAGWHLIYKIWERHNKQLHETQKITELEGVPLLNQIIEEERNYGLCNLPAVEFSNMFCISKENL